MDTIAGVDLEQRVAELVIARVSELTGRSVIHATAVARVVLGLSGQGIQSISILNMAGMLEPTWSLPLHAPDERRRFRRQLFDNDELRGHAVC